MRPVLNSSRASPRPFSSWTPAESNVMPDPTSRSFVVPETSTSALQDAKALLDDVA